jgi:carboxymethylenebutenolidase
MAIETSTVDVTAHDGGSFHALLAVPERVPAPGVLLLHEIFAVNEYIEGAAERLAALGYVVLAPDLFWRIDPDHPLDHSDAGLGEAFDRVQRLDMEEAVRDADAALAHLSQLEHVNGSVAALGFCLGGTLAFACGLRSEPDAVVSYYGSGVGDLLVDAGALHCPALFIFGGDDPFIPNDVPSAVSEAFADRDDVEVRVFEGAGHAFDNSFAPMFHHPTAAITAWGVAADFLARALPR